MTHFAGLLTRWPSGFGETALPFLVEDDLGDTTVTQAPACRTRRLSAVTGSPVTLEEPG